MTENEKVRIKLKKNKKTKETKLILDAYIQSPRKRRQRASASERLFSSVVCEEQPDLHLLSPCSDARAGKVSFQMGRIFPPSAT